MSKYTTEVRFICEHSAGLSESVGYSSIETVLDASRQKVFDFDYPIFDEAYRATLEKKILKHYYTREICCETVGLWKLFLNCKMNEIMPYYNQLYKSALIEFNPLYDVDLTIDHHRTNDGENESNRAINEIGKYNENSSEALNENSKGSYSEDSGNSYNENSNGTYNENTSGKSSEKTDGTFNENDTYGENKSRTNSINSNEETSKTDNTASNQTSNETNHSETDNESANKNDHWEYFSDTPEGGINGVEDLSYLTNATHITDDGTGSTSGSETDGRRNIDSDTVTNNESAGNKDVTTTENGVDTTASDRIKTGSDNKAIDKDSESSTAGDNNKNTSGESNKSTTGETDKTTNRDNSKATSGDNAKDINESNLATIKNIEDYLEHVVGKRGSMSYSKMLEEFRKTFLNIDMLVINDLRDLFLNLW